ncbi:2Fe-2S iron-sulfur cluster binding domain-containing protein [Vibrio fluvialis]|nr:2Fe-2S iron-sulfur cluster binding domain-containing protein [Vibrio fluvialis]MBY8012851.1 2Fe-2S iron-sulfur cluster binding domain-containing protein [Vibrio fluvialis]MBY8015147.1 2Fe-2S iron-sulfur cluster binding domain-containing protein [Vibrio fluvialis]
MAAEEADAIVPSKLIEVAFTNSDKSVHIAQGETVHAAEARAGLTIPKACSMGICGTRKVNKVSGNVEMLHNGGITDEDVAEGYILSCCSITTENVIVEYRASGH